VRYRLARAGPVDNLLTCGNAVCERSQKLLQAARRQEGEK